LNVGRIYKVFAKEGDGQRMNGRFILKRPTKLRQPDNTANLTTEESHFKNIKATTEYLPKSFFIKEGNFEFENEKCGSENSLQLTENPILL
jgi:AsmA protein